jgi:Mg2+ and Co2+ transporter CorA
MVASFWGMNVLVPLAEAQYGFWLILIFSLIMTVVVTILLIKKGLF